MEDRNPGPVLMTPLAPPIQVVLAALVLAAAVCDIRSRDIPNWLTLGGIAAGLALHPYLTGWTGLKFAGSGLGLAIVKAIADRHAATLVLDVSPRLGGLCATVVFARAA